jgi:vesicle transport through interaction with t-SNAREs 1
LPVFGQQLRIMENTETELFDLHHRRYCEAATSVQNLMDKIGSERFSGEQESLCEQIESKLKEMDSQLKRMNLERGQMTDPALAQSCQKKIKSLQADAANLRQTFRSKQASSDRTSLRAGGGAGGQVRGQLLSNQAALDRSAARLEEGLAALDETERVGIATLANLASQRETLEHSRQTLSHADERLTQARKHLVAMGRRLSANKAAMYCVIGSLLMLILYLIVRNVW